MNVEPTEEVMYFYNTKANFSYDQPWTNNTGPDGSQQPCQTFNYVLAILSAVCAVSCVIGNGLTLPTFARQSRRLGRTPTIFLFQAMAVADLLVVVPFTIVSTYPEICRITTGMTGFCWRFHKVWSPWLIKYVWPLGPVGQVASVGLTVSVAYHRYRAVCTPFKVHNGSLMTRLYLEVATIWIFSLLFNASRFFEFYIEHGKDEFNNTIYILKHSALYKNQLYQALFKSICYFVLINLLPLVLLSVLTNKLNKALKAAMVSQRELTTAGYNQRRSHREQTLTVTLIVVVIVFFICQIPTAVHRIWTAVAGFPVCSSVAWYWLGVSNLLVNVNSSVNFYIYTSCSSSFRYHLKMLLTCGKGTCCGKNIVTNHSELDGNRRTSTRQENRGSVNYGTSWTKNAGNKAAVSCISSSNSAQNNETKLPAEVGRNGSENVQNSWSNQATYRFDLTVPIESQQIPTGTITEAKLGNNTYEQIPKELVNKEQIIRVNSTDDGTKTTAESISSTDKTKHVEDKHIASTKL